MKRVLFASPWWHNELMLGVSRQAAKHGWHLDLQVVSTTQLPARWSGDGVITTLGGAPLHTIRDFFADLKCPAVSLSLNRPEIDIPRVGIDNDAAGRLAVQHFLERCFRHYAFFYTDMRPHVQGLRYRGFQHHLGKAGHTAMLLLWDEARKDREDTWKNRQAWLRQELQEAPKPLAVLSDDASGVEVIEACIAAGLRVPEDVSVLGMLDMPLFRESSTVSLSSIKVDLDKNARVACDLLARMMAGEPPPTDPILFPPTGIAVRQSTDTIAASTPEVARAVQFMRDHCPEPIDMQDVARAAGLSHTPFYKAFRSDLGLSPGAILTRIRLDKARRMLCETTHKLHVIAEACGFGDRVNLHRNFKRHLDTSPAAYRRSHREVLRSWRVG